MKSRTKLTAIISTLVAATTLFVMRPTTTTTPPMQHPYAFAKGAQQDGPGAEALLYWADGSVKWAMVPTGTQQTKEARRASLAMGRYSLNLPAVPAPLVTTTGYFLTREQGGEYPAYYAQEYDPASASFLLYAATGNQAYLDNALTMAATYADTFLSSDGGSYSHYASNNAVEAEVYRQVVAFFPPYSTDAELRSMGAPQDLLDQAPPANPERTSYVALKWAEYLIPRQLKSLMPPAQSPQDGFERLGQDPLMQAYGFFGDSTEFFAEHGGSWVSPPKFFADPHPTRKRRHQGGHSLAEMLVYGYAFTGDQMFKDAALKALAYHGTNIVPEALAGIAAQQGTKSVREIAWPLINLMALSDFDPNNQTLQGAITQLRDAIIAVPPSNYSSAVEVHMGIAMEALARHHERTGDAASAAGMQVLANYAAPNPPADDWARGLMLYGMSYAYSLDPSPAKLAVVQAFIPSSTAYSDAKDFAQKWRSVPRAFELF